MNEQTRKYVTVYCGSAINCSPRAVALAEELGAALAASGAGLVSGAGRTGLMGGVVRGCRRAGGYTVGVIPRFMVERGWHNTDVDELLVVDSMHSRKARMMELACGVIALPGGVGTLEELLEAITWRQLGLFKGNIAILNYDGYYDSLISMFGRAIDCGYMPSDHSALFAVTATVDEAVRAALNHNNEISLTAKL